MTALNRDTVLAAVKSLESAGLVVVERSSGRHSRYRILQPEPDLFSPPDDPAGEAAEAPADPSENPTGRKNPPVGKADDTGRKNPPPPVGKSGTKYCSEVPHEVLNPHSLCSVDPAVSEAQGAADPPPGGPEKIGDVLVGILGENNGGGFKRSRLETALIAHSQPDLPAVQKALRAEGFRPSTAWLNRLGGHLETGRLRPGQVVAAVNSAKAAVLQGAIAGGPLRIRDPTALLVTRVGDAMRMNGPETRGPGPVSGSRRRKQRPVAGTGKAR